MADEERLGLGFDVDTSGLAVAEREALGFLDELSDRFRTANLAAPEIDTAQLQASLTAAGAPVDQFFRGLPARAEEGLTRLEAVLRGFIPPPIPAPEVRPPDLAPIERAVLQIPPLFAGVRPQIGVDLSPVIAAIRTVPQLVAETAAAPIPLLANPEPFERTLRALPAAVEATTLPPLRLTADASPVRALLSGLREDVPPFQVPIDVGTLGQFRAAIREVGTDVNAAEALFREFAAGAEAELASFGVTGTEAARIINLVWHETLEAARAADQANAPIAALTSGLADVTRLLGAIPATRRLLPGALQDARDVALLNGEMVEFQRHVAESRPERLLSAGAPVAPPPQQGPTLLSSQADPRLAQNALQNAAAIDRMGEAQNRAGREAEFLSKGTRDNIRYSELQAVAAAQAAEAARGGAGAFEFHGKAVNRATNAITALAATSLSAEGPVARLAESALLFGGGEVAVVALAGGVLALASAYNFANAAEREAAETRERLVKGLLQESDQAIPATIRALQALTAAREAERQARQDKSLGDVLTAPIGAGDGRSGLGASGSIITSVASELARRESQAQVDAAKAEAQAERDLGEAQRQRGAETAQALAQAIQFHIADASAIERARTQVSALQLLEQNTNLTLGERVELHRQLVTLQDALTNSAREEEEVRERLRQQAIQAQSNNVAELAAAPVLGTDTSESRIERAAEEQRLQAIIKDTNLPLEERNRAAREYNQLLAGSEALLERQRQAALAIAESWRDVQHTAAEATAAAVAAVQAAAAATAPDNFLQLIEHQRQQAQQAAQSDAGAFTVDTSVSAGFQRAEESVRGVEDALDDAFRASGKFGRGAVQAAEDTRTANERLADSLHGVVDGLGQILGAASNVGLIGDQAARSIDDVLRLGEAVAGVIANASAGNILGAVAAGINLVGGLTGPSQTELEHNRILEENNRRLEELNSTLGQNIGGANVADAAEVAAVGAAARLSALQLPGAGGPQGLEGQGVADEAARVRAITEADQIFQRALQEAGLSLEELAAIVKDQTGLDILDSKGHLVAGTLAQANAALQITIDQITHFGDSLDNRARVLETEDNLGIGPRAGLPENQQRLERTRDIELEGLNLDPATEARIRALDLGTEAGRQAFLAFNQMLFEMAKNGQLTAEQLGKFKNVDELLGPINDAADGLKAFTDATNDATRQLQGVPDFFNLAEAEFAARQAPLPTDRPNDGAALPTFPASVREKDRPDVTVPPVERVPAAAASRSVTFTAPIYITVDGVQDDPVETARRVRRELLNITVAESGS